MNYVGNVTKCNRKGSLSKINIPKNKKQKNYKIQKAMTKTRLKYLRETR